jgi:hypothetical protein
LTGFDCLIINPGFPHEARGQIINLFRGYVGGPSGRLDNGPCLSRNLGRLLGCIDRIFKEFANAKGGNEPPSVAEQASGRVAKRPSPEFAMPGPGRAYSPANARLKFALKILSVGFNPYGYGRQRNSHL